MSRKKRRKKSKKVSKEKPPPKLTKFQKALKEFLGEEYREALRNANFEVKRLMKKYKMKKKYAPITLLSYFQLSKMLKKRKVKDLRNFYHSYFGEKTKMSKKLLVDTFLRMHEDGVSHISKRKEEVKNIDQKYIDSTTSHFTLSDIQVPRDVMLEILSFLRSNYKLLRTLGSTNSSFYILILSNWNSVVPVNLTSILKISALIMKSMNRFMLGPRFTANEYAYLVDRFSPNRIKEIYFQKGCSANDLKKFFTFMTKKKIQFPTCQTLRFPEMFESKKEKKKRIEIPAFPFPNLQRIDQFQGNNMNLRNIKTISILELGDPFFRKVSPYKDPEQPILEKSMFRAGVYRKSRFTSQTILEFPINQSLFDNGRKIRKIITRIRFFGGLKNLENISNFLPNLESLEIDSEASLERDFRRFGFRMSGLKVPKNPGGSVFKNLVQLVELKNSSESIGGLFKKGDVVKTENLRMKKLELHNVPISIISTSLDCLPNLEVCKVGFGSYYGLEISTREVDVKMIKKFRGLVNKLFFGKEFECVEFYVKSDFCCRLKNQKMTVQYMKSMKMKKEESKQNLFVLGKMKEKFKSVKVTVLCTSFSEDFYSKFYDEELMNSLSKKYVKKIEAMRKGNIKVSEYWLN